MILSLLVLHLHISIWILRIVMYPSAKERPGTIQATMITIFVKSDVFKLMMLNYFFQKYHHGCLKGSDYTSDLV